MTVTPARGGGVYEYTGEGSMSVFPGASGIPPGWPSEASAGHMRAVDGAIVAVELSEKPLDTLSMSGNEVPAFRAQYAASFPGDQESPYVFYEENLDPETSNLVATTAPDVFASGIVQDVYMRIGRPPLFVAPFFWDRGLNAGDIGSIEYPGELYTPSSDPSNKTIDWKVVDTSQKDGECHAEIQLDPDEDRYEEIRMALSTESPLPTEYKIFYPSDFEHSQNLYIKLENMERGEGQSLAPFEKVEVYPQTELKMAPLVDGFLADAEDVFPTGYQEAHEAALAEEFVSEWLSDHPDAEPIRVQHVMGPQERWHEALSQPPTSRYYGEEVIDRWTITWVNPHDGETLTTWIDNVSTLGREELSRLEVVEVGFNWDGEWTVPEGQWIKMSEVARVHEARFGEPPEIVQCRYPDKLCSAGTHQSTNRPYGGGGSGGEGMILTGVQFWAVDHGWLLKNEFYPPEGS